MTTIANSIPTLTANVEEVNGLSPLIPFFNPHPPNPLPLLHKILDLLSEKPIADFLLNDWSTHLHTLTNPSTRQNALTCIADVFRIASPVFGLHNTTRSELLGSLIPTFEDDNRTLGIMIRQSSSNMFKDIQCTELDTRDVQDDQLWQGRFIFDIKKKLFAVTFCEGCYVRINFLTPHSAQSTGRYHISFDRQSLLELLQYPQLQTTYQVVMSSVRTFMALDSFHNCRRCKASPAQGCNCLLRDAIQQQARGRNTSKLSVILSICIGGSCGIAHNLDFARGTHLRSRAFGHVWNLRNDFDRERVNDVLKRAAEEYIQSAESDPWKTVLPQVEESNLYDSDTLHKSVSSRQDTQEGSELDLEQLDIELRKRLRLEKNRACARRSNLKKKQENDMRKRELKRLKELESQLVTRERALRSENLALRKLLNDNNGM